MDPLKKRKMDENGVAKVDSDGIAMLTLEDSRKILESFTYDQLLSIVQNALLRHSDVLDAVRSFSGRDTTQRKLFIRGLGWETTTDKLRAIFSSYGELDEAVVILDKVTGKSKGYGFITFRHIDGAIMALKEPSKKIDGRMTVTQLAAAGISGSGVPGSGGVGGVNNVAVDVSMRKIYVSNVPYDMPAERLLQHFSMYGEIEEGPLGFDKATGKSKGFALFVYKTAEAARASLVDSIKNIDGHQMNCKLAIDGKRAKPNAVGAGGPVIAPGVNQVNGDGSGTPMLGGQYGVTGGVGGHYGGYQGGLGTAGGGGGSSSVASQTSGLNLGNSGGFAGPYAGGSHFAGPIGTGYAGLGGAGGAFGGPISGLGSLSGLVSGAGGGLAGVRAGLGSAAGGGATGGTTGRGSSVYGLPNSSAAMISGDYPRYSSASGYQGHPSQPKGPSSNSRIRPGGAYQGMPPYY